MWVCLIARTNIFQCLSVFRELFHQFSTSSMLQDEIENILTTAFSLNTKKNRERETMHPYTRLNKLQTTPTNQLQTNSCRTQHCSTNDSIQAKILKIKCGRCTRVCDISHEFLHFSAYMTSSVDAIPYEIKTVCTSYWKQLQVLPIAQYVDAWVFN